MNKNTNKKFSVKILIKKKKNFSFKDPVPDPLKIPS